MRAGAELSSPTMAGNFRTINKHAKRLRQDMTDAERTLWFELPGRRFAGFKFKRQWTLGPYVLDFCCWEARLVMEADGGQHNQEVDAARTAWLEAEGYRVLRFWNNDVLTNKDGVLETILAALRPNPQAGEGA